MNENGCGQKRQGTGLFAAGLGPAPTPEGPFATVPQLRIHRNGLSPQLHGERGEALLRGDGAPRMKSEPLLFVSTHPLPARVIAVVLLNRAAAVPSAKFAEPYPTKSTIRGSLGADPLSKGDPETRATFPDAALSPIPPTASGVGS